MVKYGGNAAELPLLVGDIGIPPQGGDVLHLLDADAALLLLLDVVGLPPLLDAGLLPRLPVVDLCPPDAIPLLSSAATAPHLCLHRRGRCLVHP